ncbi:MAG TPA: TRAP transporter small permease [Gammaproteobacteria bacterium]
MTRFFAGFARSVRWLEDGLLIGVFAAMLLLAGAQIVMRNFFDAGFAWIDPLLRVLVLWIAMLGAVTATREDRHISIDVLSRFAPPKFLPLLKRIIALATSLICGLLAWHTFRFVRDEYAWSDVEIAGLPVWIWQSILPLGFALMTWRFLFAVVFPARAEPGT